ncbi:MAG: DUF3194 domain-containing protein [Candidatus Lokiarchaeota archaeon]|nr:DUF3194 domain-containing protein [Candidatus Lokiarchaeota archaeon]
MSPLLEIGLPNLSDTEIEKLAEECENEVTQYILEQVPKKSLEQIVVVCMFELSSGQLDISIDIDIIQRYETNHNLNEIINDAITHGISWIEEELQGMK